MKIKKYLIEAEEETDDSESESDGLTQKVKILATVMNKKEDLPKMKRALRKAMAGKVATDEERELIKSILQFFFSADTSKFKMILRRLG